MSAGAEQGLSAPVRTSPVTSAEVDNFLGSEQMGNMI